MYVNTDSDDQNGEYAEENDSVHQNGNPTGIHIPKLHHPDSRRQLKKQPWWQDNEQRHRHNNRSPICTHLNLQEEECSEVVEFFFKFYRENWRLEVGEKKRGVIRVNELVDLLSKEGA